MSELIEKTAWPAEGIEQGSLPEDYTWGYLYLFSTGSPVFIEDEKPSLDEINARWGHYFR